MAFSSPKTNYNKINNNKDYLALLNQVRGDCSEALNSNSLEQEQDYLEHSDQLNLNKILDFLTNNHNNSNNNKQDYLGDLARLKELD